LTEAVGKESYGRAHGLHALHPQAQGIKLYHSQTSQKHIQKLHFKPRNNDIYNNLRKGLFLLGRPCCTLLHFFPQLYVFLKGWNMPLPKQGCWDKFCLPITFPMISAYRKETPHTVAAASLEHMWILHVQDRLCLHLCFGVLSDLSLLQRAAAPLPTRGDLLLLRHVSYSYFCVVQASLIWCQ